MEYNTTREHLIISEYGRNIQKMVEYVLTIPDKANRTILAKQIIKEMAVLNPEGKEAPDYWQKLWNHLYVISGCRLDIDYPKGQPDGKIQTIQHSSLPYSQNQIQFRTYGKHIEKMIREAANIKDERRRQMMSKALAWQLKNQNTAYNNKAVEDSVFDDHLTLLSGGKLSLNGDIAFLRDPKAMAQTNGTIGNAKKKKKKKKKKSTTVQPAGNAAQSIMASN